MGRIYVLHENEAWVEPLREAFTDLGLAFDEWFLDGGVLDLESKPPEGVFYNRMSASSHTRGHRYGPEYAGAVLAWLERHGRRVVRALFMTVWRSSSRSAENSCGIRRD